MGISSEIRKTNSLSSLHHYNHQQGGGLPRKRLQSQASTMNKPSNNSNSQLLRTKSMSDSLKVGVELNEYQLYGARRNQRILRTDQRPVSTIMITLTIQRHRRVILPITRNTSVEPYFKCMRRQMVLVPGT